MFPVKTIGLLFKLASKQSPHNAPDNPGLWSQAISEAKKRFTVYPSAYANGWAAKWYKERGGGWHKEKEASVARKDVGHGGLDEWFSGHGKDKGQAQWGDWVSISPVRKQLQSGRVVEPGDIVGQCGISGSPDWRQYTKGGQDPLKCMPRKKAEAMSKEQRAALAKGKARAERSSGNTGKPVMTRTFSKRAMNVMGGEPIGDSSDDAGPFPSLIPNVIRFPNRASKARSVPPRGVVKAASAYSGYFDFGSKDRPLTSQFLRKAESWRTSDPTFYPMQQGAAKVTNPLSDTEQGPPMTWQQAATEFNRLRKSDNLEYANENWSQWRRAPGTINKQDPGQLNFDNLYPNQPRDVVGPPLPMEIGYQQKRLYDAEQEKQKRIQAEQKKWQQMSAEVGRAAAERQSEERLGKMSDWSNNLEKLVQVGFTPNVSPRDAAANRYGGYAAADAAFNTANQYGAGLDPKTFRTSVPVMSAAAAGREKVPDAVAYYEPDKHAIYLQEFGSNALAHELNHAQFPRTQQTGEPSRPSGFVGKVRNWLGLSEPAPAPPQRGGRFYERLVPTGEYDDAAGHHSIRGEMQAEHLRGLKEWWAARGNTAPTNPREAEEVLNRFIYQNGAGQLRNQRNNVSDEDFLRLQKNPNIGTEILQTVRAPTNNLTRPT